MNANQKIVALSQQALDSGKITNEWEHDFLLGIIRSSRKWELSLKQKQIAYKILKSNGCYKDYL